jgi:hypothetical protein
MTKILKNPYFWAAFATLFIWAWMRRRRKLRPELEVWIDKLHPIVQNRFRAFIKDIEETTPYTVKIFSSHRGYDQAASLKARLPELATCCPVGGDYHFYGFAIDLGLDNGKGKVLGLNSPKSEWEATGIRKIARKHGLRWGIDFLGYRSPSDDPVHFDWPAYSISALQKAAIQQFGSIRETGNRGNRLNLKGVPTKSQELKKSLKSGWADCSSAKLYDQQLC